jgi:hypothetical protein
MADMEACRNRAAQSSEIPGEAWARRSHMTLFHYG